jgi:hypothetical protein
MRWAAPRLDVRFTQVSEAGELEGLIELKQGRGLDVRPYAAGSWVSTPGLRDLSTQKDVGADLFFNITPSLKLTGTVNTDFAETEVDNRQINLTRFPLFFPEKRAFFLENAGVFNFGAPPTGGAGGGTELLPFFSRRIGLFSGEEVPILAGLKLAGKVGRYDVGVLDIRTQDSQRADRVAEGQNFFVARIKRNIWTQSYIGGIFTDGDPGASTVARTFGADVRLSTSRFLGGRRNFNVDGYALKVANQGVQDQDGSYGLAVSYPNDTWNLGVDWRRIERNFRPALGFVQRSDISRINTTSNFGVRPREFLGLRRIFFQFMVNRYVRLEHSQVENWRVFTAPVHLTWNSGDRFEVNWVPTFERLFAPFTLSGVTLPPGSYRFDRYRVEFFSSPNRAWKVDTTWWFGTYWSGRADQISGQFQYKWAPHLDTSFRYDQTFARLKEGVFAARIFSLRANYSFTPFLTIFNLAQYDNDTKNLGWQSRVRWILRPGREIFLVFNQGWIRELNEAGSVRFREADRGFATKAQYTLRF